MLNKRVNEKINKKKFKDKIKKILFQPTTNTLLQLFRYSFVGGFSFLGDGIVLFLLEKVGLHYTFAAALSFIVGLMINFLLSKALVFKNQESNKSMKAQYFKEFVVYGIIGIVGLVLTELIMLLLIEIFNIYFMLSKIVAAIIVLMWNFLARKFILYK